MVANLKLNLTRYHFQRHDELSHPAVLQYVVKRFLSDPEEAQGDILRQIFWKVFVRELDAYLVLLCIFVAKAADGGHDAQVIKLGGMQLVAIARCPVTKVISEGGSTVQRRTTRPR